MWLQNARNAFCKGLNFKNFQGENAPTTTNPLQRTACSSSHLESPFLKSCIHPRNYPCQVALWRVVGLCEIPRCWGSSKAKIVKGKYEPKLEFPEGRRGSNQRALFLRTLYLLLIRWARRSVFKLNTPCNCLFSFLLVSFNSFLTHFFYRTLSISKKEIIPWLLKDEPNVIICVADSKADVPQILISAQRKGTIVWSNKHE